MSYNEAIQEAKDQMQKAFEYLEKELKGIRTGRASSALVEFIKVEAWGSLQDIRSVAHFTSTGHRPSPNARHSECRLQAPNATRRESLAKTSQSNHPGPRPTFSCAKIGQCNARPQKRHAKPGA